MHATNYRIGQQRTWAGRLPVGNCCWSDSGRITDLLSALILESHHLWVLAGAALPRRGSSLGICEDKICVVSAFRTRLCQRPRDQRHVSQTCASSTAPRQCLPKQVKIAGPVVFLYPSGFAGSAVVVNAVFDNREERIPALAEFDSISARPGICSCRIQPPHVRVIRSGLLPSAYE